MDILCRVRGNLRVVSVCISPMASYHEIFIRQTFLQGKMKTTEMSSVDKATVVVLTLLWFITQVTHEGKKCAAVVDVSENEDATPCPCRCWHSELFPPTSGWSSLVCVGVTRGCTCDIVRCLVQVAACTVAPAGLDTAEKAHPLHSPEDSASS